MGVKTGFDPNVKTQGEASKTQLAVLRAPVCTAPLESEIEDRFARPPIGFSGIRIMCHFARVHRNQITQPVKNNFKRAVS